MLYAASYYYRLFVYEAPAYLLPIDGFESKPRSTQFDVALFAEKRPRDPYFSSISKERGNLI